VFSQRGADGKPVKLWDRSTGVIDGRTSQSWLPYDIARRLDENWRQLEPKLNGRLFVYCGTADTFYLDGAVILLREMLEKKQAKALVEMIPDADHGSFLTRPFREKMARQMEKVLQANREGAKP
jgi:dienelactone hydrolase